MEHFPLQNISSKTETIEKRVMDYIFACRETTVYATAQALHERTSRVWKIVRTLEALGLVGRMVNVTVNGRSRTPVFATYKAFMFLVYLQIRINPSDVRGPWFWYTSLNSSEGLLG